MPPLQIIFDLYNDKEICLYFNRFINYIISKLSKRNSIHLFGKNIHISITGHIIEDNSNTEYESFQSLYLSLSDRKNNNNKSIKLVIFRQMFVAKGVNIWRLLCNVNEDDIINFFDLNYRAYRLFQDLAARINCEQSASLQILFHNKICTLTSSQIISDSLNQYQLWYLLHLYEIRSPSAIQYSIDRVNYLYV